MECFQVRYDSRVVIYERKLFIRLATGAKISLYKNIRPPSSLKLIDLRSLSDFIRRGWIILFRNFHRKWPKKLSKAALYSLGTTTLGYSWNETQEREEEDSFGLVQWSGNLLFFFCCCCAAAGEISNNLFPISIEANETRKDPSSEPKNSDQCDQIWRNFTALAKFKKSLEIWSRVYLVFGIN